MIKLATVVEINRDGHSMTVVYDQTQRAIVERAADVWNTQGANSSLRRVV